MFLLLLACADPDLDGDGVTASLDCDDDNASMHPNAGEVCDGIDNDCDGYIDEVGDLSEPLVYFPDSDGDGLGDSTRIGLGCEVPEGHSVLGGDCDDEDASIGAGTEWPLDLDGDGYAGALTLVACQAPVGTAEQGGDCNDGNPLAFPGAPETCNGQDEDCDGVADNDPVDPGTFYVDADADGWGDEAIQACAGDGLSSRDGDCDDDDDQVHPGATETCDEVDQDCDGSVDEDATDGSTWYADLDLDGYGGVVTTVSCEAPSEHWLADGGADCNDGDPATNPGADEYCDHRDNDCDGTTDEDDALDALVWYADTDGDGYGDADLSTVACEQPSAFSDDDTDCDDSDDTTNPGESEVCEDGADNDCDGTANQCVISDAETDDADWALLADNANNEYLGWRLALSDLDGDGYDDVAVSDMYWGGSNPGRIFLAYGANSLSSPDISTLSTLTHATSNQYAGSSLAGAGDVNGDGYEDLLVGAESGNSNGGKVYLVLGQSGGPSGSLSSQIEYTSTASTTYDRLGSDVAGGGDIDGDGYDDLLLGNYRYNDGGRVTVVYGSASPSGGSIDGEPALTATQQYAYVGYRDTLAIVGDIDGDGYDDSAVGAYRYEVNQDEGAIALVYGSSAGWSSMTFPTGADAWVIGDETYGYLHATAQVGDVDGDGYDDLVFGAQYANSYRGEVYLFLGSTTAYSGSFDLADAVATWRGEELDDYLGGCLAGGDLDNDGKAEIAAGAHGSDLETSVGGATYILPGGSWSGSMKVHEEAVAVIAGSDYAAYSSRALAVGDVNGDGYGDLLIGGHNAPNDDGYTNGAAWLFLGTGM